jgi:hypothetical protein
MAKSQWGDPLLRGADGGQSTCRHEPAAGPQRPRAMRKIRLFMAALVGLLASGAVAARADEAKLSDFAQRMFATKSFEQKASACFVRTYDAGHLARHRRQTVSAMKMLVSAETLADDGQLSYSYELGVKFRNRSGDYVSRFQCGRAHMADVKRTRVEVTCHDGCEGGDGVVIALTPDSKSIHVRIDSVSVWLPDKPSDADGHFEFHGGPDNHVFRLDRVDLENCKSLVRDGDEVAVSQPE